MKKYLSIVLAASMVLSLGACGQKTEDKTTTEAVVTTQAPKDDKTTEAAPADTTVADTEKEEATTQAPVEETKAPVEETKAPAAEGTKGETLKKDFEASVGSYADINALVEHLVENEVCEFMPAVMDVEEGFLNGFSAEINGFSKGVMFGPMIGSIPFIGYVFETEDADALVATLKANADLRWNICTSADEMVVTVKDNKVFFVMCSNAEEE